MLKLDLSVLSPLSLESLSSVAFMLASCSSMLTASITMTGTMTVSEDSASACKNSDSFDDDVEESLLNTPSTRLKGWKAGLVWVQSSSILQATAYGMLKPAIDFYFKASEAIRVTRSAISELQFGTSRDFDVIVTMVFSLAHLVIALPDAA